MSRITKQDVLVQLDGINEELAKNHAEYRLACNGRYNYHVIEAVTVENPYQTMRDPFVAGSMRDCYNFCAAFLRGMWAMQSQKA